MCKSLSRDVSSTNSQMKDSSPLVKCETQAQSDRRYREQLKAMSKNWVGVFQRRRAKRRKIDFKGHSRSIPGRCPFCHCRAKSISRHIKCCFKNPRSKYYDPKLKRGHHRHKIVHVKIRCQFCKQWIKNNNRFSHYIKCQNYPQQNKLLFKHKFFVYFHRYRATIFHSPRKKWNFQYKVWPRFGRYVRDLLIPQAKTVFLYKSYDPLFKDMQQQLYSMIKAEGLDCLWLQPKTKLSFIKKQINRIFQARSFIGATERSRISDGQQRQFQWAI